MKRTKIFLMLTLTPFFGFYLTNNGGLKSANGNNIEYQHNAKKALMVLESNLNKKLKVDWNSNSTISFISGRLTSPGYSGANKAEDGVKFLKENNELFGLKDAAQELQPLNVERDESGMIHIKYQQQINGIKVYQGQLWIHFNEDGSVESVNGSYYPTPKISTIPALSKAAAIISAKNYLVNYKYLDESTELLIYEKAGKLLLTYAVSLPGYWTPGMIVYVNANNGNILKVDNGIRYDGPATGTGIGLNGQVKNLNTYLWNNDYVLIDATLPMFKAPIDSFFTFGTIATFDALNDTNGNGYEKVGLIGDPNKDNNFNDNERLQAAVDAHISSRTIYQFYKTHFNRNSFDNNGKSIVNVIHFKENYNNAFWNGVCLTYGDGDGQQYSNLTGAFDVITHEFTHAVNSYSADLLYENQSGALSEHMSDAFGSIADSTDWLMGEDVYTPGIAGDGLRSMQDPHNGKADGDVVNGWLPAHMNEFVNLQNTEEQDWGGVHINCGIPNKAFYLVASAIGHWKTGKIWYKTLTQYLTRNSQFIDLRNGCIASAKDLYGENSEAYNKVVQAFDAVGIGGSGSGESVELCYDDDNPETGVYESTAGWGLAVKFTPPAANAELTNIKVFINGDYLSGSGSFILRAFTENPATGLPGADLINPYSHNPNNWGWQSFDVSGVTVPGEFFISAFYDGNNYPLLGADNPPGNGKAYEYDPSTGWYRLTSPYDFTLFIRATVKTVTGVVDLDSRIPEKFELSQNYPNPFNPSTSIKYLLPEAVDVNVSLFDMTGKEVAVIVNNFQNAGSYEVTWNGKNNNGHNAASGIYICRIKAGNNTGAIKMILMK